MVSMVWLGIYALSAPHYNQNRLAMTMFHSHPAVIRTRLSFAPGCHSRLAVIRAWLSFAIGQRLWFERVSVITNTADYDQKQTLESSCLFAYI
jgi:hypothetical protein